MGQPGSVVDCMRHNLTDCRTSGRFDRVENTSAFVVFDLVRIELDTDALAFLVSASDFFDLFSAGVNVVVVSVFDDDTVTLEQAADLVCG